MSHDIEQIGCFEVVRDRYKGLTIKDDTIPLNTKVFDKNLDVLISQALKNGCKLLWVYLSCEKSNLIPVATARGFEFHTCESDKVLMVKSLVSNAIIPTASNHTLGVGVVVINEKDELLVIKERFSTIGFKLPGGHIDDGELIQNAVKREVKEETGIDVEFSSIISLGHFYPHQFNKSNLYILCTAQAKSYEIRIEDTQEIVDCKWINVHEYINSEETFEYNKVIVSSALNFNGLKNIDLESFKQIPKNYELFFSI